MALCFFLATIVLRVGLNTVGNLTASRSFVPDITAFFGYMLLIAGLLGFSHWSEWRNRKPGMLLDGLIAAVALASMAWVQIIQPLMLRDEAIPIALTLIIIAYPSLSILILVLAFWIVYSPEQERTASLWLLFISLACFFVGDVFYLFAEVGLLHLPADLIDLPYALSFLAAAATAAHPTMRKLTEPAKNHDDSWIGGRIVVVGIALIIPTILTLTNHSTSIADRLVLSSLMLCMTVAAIARITQALHSVKVSENRLRHQAYHDELTGLPNRRKMENYLEQTLEQTVLDGTHVALIYMDLDRFKLINDTLGHTRGDILLTKVAERLSANVRPSNLVARIGGDEFTVTLTHVISPSHALDLANRLLGCIRPPFIIDEIPFYLSASIGLAFASHGEKQLTVEELLRNADVAMHQAKDRGPDTAVLFDESMRTNLTERVELERSLYYAIALNQLRLEYQPIVQLPSHKTVGIEALARWLHPLHGEVPPSKFIPLAEEGDLINKIGDWALEEALGQLATWRRQFPEMADTYVSVNLSGVQLHSGNVVERVAELLKTYKLKGSSLCLELTESVLMKDPEFAATVLGDLRRLDVRVAIDDFGSEYSSLAYVRRLPATILKIDRAFIGNLENANSPDATLVAAITAMARALKISAVAEGVETAAQARHIAKLGCTTIQGFFYSRPVAAKILPQRIKEIEEAKDTRLAIDD